MPRKDGTETKCRLGNGPAVQQRRICCICCVPSASAIASLWTTTFELGLLSACTRMLNNISSSRLKFEEPICLSFFLSLFPSRHAFQFSPHNFATPQFTQRPDASILTDVSAGPITLPSFPVMPVSHVLTIHLLIKSPSTLTLLLLYRHVYQRRHAPNVRGLSGWHECAMANLHSSVMV
jgi:hypothetical protein